LKRGVIDVLRRGLDNTIANWPLILIRIAEAIVFVMLVIAAVIAILAPILVSVGIEVSKIDTPDDIEGAVSSLLTRWVLLLWIVVAFSFVFLLMIAIHAFVEAGCARVYVDAERIAGPQTEGPRTRFQVFSMQRWFAGATDGWWTLFWIYNLAWGVAGLILLIPLLPTLVLMLLLREQVPVALGIGCIGLLAFLMLLIVVGVLTGMWTHRAIASWAVRRWGARDALAVGWRAVRTDFGRHLLVALAAIVVSMAGSTFFAGFGFFAGIGEGMSNSDLFALATLPVRFAGSFFSTIFSAAVTSWYLASYAALATERPEPLPTIR
jgi:hypothetical protein